MILWLSVSYEPLPEMFVEVLFRDLLNRGYSGSQSD